MLDLTAIAKHRVLALTVLVFGFIATARLVTLHYFAYDIPFWDQWDSEVWILLQPFQKGELDWRILFSPHNEHRILFSRLTTLALFIANNRQWDNLVETCFNTLFYSCAFALFLRRLILELPWRDYAILFALIIFVACLPFCSENFLSGFQNQFYYMITLTVTGLWVAVSGRPTFGRIAGLTLISAGCVFCMASGALSIPAFLAAAVLRSWRERRERGRLILLIVILMPIALTALAWVPRIPGHEPFRVQNLGEFLSAAILAMSWPLPENWEWALVLWGPYAWAGIQMLRRRITDPLGIAALSLGAWIILQALAMSYVRGHEIDHIATRYTEILSFGVLVNAYFAIRYYTQLQNRSKFGALATSIFLIVYAGGMVARTKQGVEEMITHAAFSRLQINNVRHFIKTEDLIELKKQPIYHIPYPDADRLGMMLKDPIVRDILPPSIRPSIPLEGNDSFVKNGYFPIMSNSAMRSVLGSYTPTEGNRNVGQMTAVLKTRFPYLGFEIAGYPDQVGMRFSLASANPQREQPILPPSTPKESWTPLSVSVPAAEFTLEASDINRDSWFAFTEPVEIGRLSLWIPILLSHVIPIAGIYVFIVVLSMTYFWLIFCSRQGLESTNSAGALAKNRDFNIPQPAAYPASDRRVLRHRNSSFDLP